MKKKTIPSSLPSDGVIQFNYSLSPFEQGVSQKYLQEFQNLEKIREILFEKNYVGFDPLEKVGFGNISCQIDNSPEKFLITASQTGHLPHLTFEHYSLIEKCDLVNNNVKAQGDLAPSSESLTHYALYISNPKIKVVLHIHHEKFWQKMIAEKAPATPEDISYGSVAMAKHAAALTLNQSTGLFVMKGHHGGIISYAQNLEDALNALLRLEN